jgi:hypothetical protein
MPFDPWKDINEKILKCRRLKTDKERIACLENLFGEIRDGMVANVLGEEYEAVGDIESARKYFRMAEELFPLQDYKDQARRALGRLESTPIGASRRTEQEERAAAPVAINLAEIDPAKTLIVVGCTKTKVWDMAPDAPEFVPARCAYKGQDFIRFLNWAESEAVQLEKKGFRWVILSAKYGFLEPWHPIANYDIPMEDADVAISPETLKAQTRQVKPGKAGQSKAKAGRLADYRIVICVNCPKTYIERVQAVFCDAKVTSV